MICRVCEYRKLKVNVNESRRRCLKEGARWWNSTEENGGRNLSLNIQGPHSKHNSMKSEVRERAVQERRMIGASRGPALKSYFWLNLDFDVKRKSIFFSLKWYI